MSRRDRRGEPAAEGAGHASGHRRVGPPPTMAGPPAMERAKPAHDQPWIPKSGLIGRSRRSARRG